MKGDQEQGKKKVLQKQTLKYDAGIVENNQNWKLHMLYSII